MCKFLAVTLKDYRGALPDLVVPIVGMASIITVDRLFANMYKVSFNCDNIDGLRFTPATGATFLSYEEHPPADGYTVLPHMKPIDIVTKSSKLMKLKSDYHKDFKHTANIVGERKPNLTEIKNAPLEYLFPIFLR